MAQHDYTIANQGFPAFRSDLNDALAAIVSNNSGATEPTTMFAHMIWVDTAANPSILKIRNADNDAWITIGSIDQTGDRFILAPAGGSAAAPSVSASGDLDTGLFFPGSNVLGFATNGVESARFNASGNLAFPNGKGLDFSSVAGGGATSSLLDDYEEGSFTVTLTCGTSGTITVDSSVNEMSYIKIGNQVTIFGRFFIGSVSSPVGSINMNLPFASINSFADQANYMGIPMFTHDINLSANVISVFAEITPGGSTALFYQTFSNAAWVALPASNLTGSGPEIFYVTGSYFAA